LEWSIGHLDENDPKFDVTVTLYEIGVGQVKQWVYDDQTLGYHKQEWDPEAPGPRLYVYEVYADHDFEPGFPGEHCDDQTTSRYLTISDVSLTDSELHVREKHWQFTVNYTLNREAGGCHWKAYNPDLTQIGEGDLPVPAGAHSQPVLLGLDHLVAGRYHVVVFATEDDDTRKSNRDYLAKCALQKGAVVVYKPDAWGVPGGGRWAFSVARNCVIRACYQGGDWGDIGWLRQEWPAYGENPDQFPPPGYNSSCLTQPTDAETIYYRLNDLLKNGQDNPKEDGVLFYMGHGEPNRLLPGQYDPGFTILWGQGYPNQPEAGHYCINQMVGHSLERCVLAVPLACSSNLREPFKGSVQEGLGAEGADCVLGFEHVHEEFAAKAWSDAFWKYLCGLPDSEGNTHVTVAAAHEAALDAIEGEDKGGMETCTFVCQDGVSETTLQIRPARWGQ
jgi:hypothetical protein